MSLTTRMHRFERPISLLALIAMLLVPAASGSGKEKACATARAVDLNATVRLERRDPQATDLLRLTYPAAGVASIRVSSPEDAGARLAYLGNSCKASGNGFAVIEETPGALLLQATAGTHFFTVAPEDPERPLWSYQVRTAFAPEPARPDEILTLRADPPASCAATTLPSFTPEPFAEDRFVELRLDALTKDVDPDDCDVVSGGLVEPGVVIVESDEPLEATLYDGRDCVPSDRLAEGFLGNGRVVASAVHAGDLRLDLRKASSRVSYGLEVKYFALCGRGEQDDHADTPLCATPLAVGAAASGALEGALWDEDYFTFQVAGQTTVELRVDAEDQVTAALHDARGQRLEAWEACSESAGRMVRTLGRGRYYVGVQGDGRYSVVLEPPE